MSVVFEKRHEGGDLSEYDANVTDGGRLSVASAAALASSDYGLSVYVNSQTLIYAYDALAANNTSGVVRLRAYVDPNGCDIPADATTSFVYLVNGSMTETICSLQLGRNSSDTAYFLRAVIALDGGGVVHCQNVEITDAPHYIEVLVHRATGSTANNGYLTEWVDGVEEETISGQDNYDRFASLRMLIAGFAAPTDNILGTYYVDEIIVNDDGSEIGPVSSSTEYQQSASGGITFAGAGLKSTIRTVAGGLGFAGAAVKAMLRLLSGGISFVGSASTAIIRSLSTAGGFTFSGLVERQTSHINSGDMAFSGITLKTVNRLLDGVVAMAGEINKYSLVIIDHEFSISASLERISQRAIAGALEFSGIAEKTIGKLLDGAIDLSRSLVAVLVNDVTDVALNGEITFSGNISKSISIQIAGILSFLGALFIYVTGQETPAERVIVIPAELRVINIIESRTYSISPDLRTIVC